MGSVLPSIIPVALSVVSGGTKQSAGKQQGEIQQQQIAQQSQADDEKRQRALRAAMATRRARYGASGISTNDGSAEAVLLGMFQESEEELQNRLERDTLRMRAVNQSTESAGSRNLLSLTSSVFSDAFGSTFLN